MTKPDRPKSEFRISTDRLRLLEPGLKELAAWNVGPAAGAEALFPLKCGKGAFSKQYYRLVNAIAQKVQGALAHPNASGKVRLRFDCFELSIFMLAGRRARIIASTKAEREKITNLLAYLEALRKRAVRLYVSAKGWRSYAQASRCWQQFVRWARVNILRKIPRSISHPRVNTGRFWPKVNQEEVRLAKEVATRELTRRGAPVPPEPELHSLVRRVFRMAERSMTAPGMRTLLYTPEGAQWLATFISRKTADEHPGHGGKA